MRDTIPSGGDGDGDRGQPGVGAASFHAGLSAIPLTQGSRTGDWDPRLAGETWSHSTG